MRVLPCLLFASGALAVAVAPQHHDRQPADYDCFLSNRREMAADARCGNHIALSLCFSQLTDSDPNAIAKCYRTADCHQAEEKALGAQDRCAKLFPGDAELRRRRAVLDQAVAPVTQADAYGTVELFGKPTLVARAATIGSDCLTTRTEQTRTCPLETVDGSTRTESCFTTDVETSDCAPGKTCSMDSSGNDICMDLQNSLDIAGIIIAIVFGVSIILGVGSLTFLCCRDRKQQKRMAAAAEAKSLARAATRKKKAAEAREQRAPLMAQQRRDASTGSTDPFHDRNRS
jgi:hypothetical protein